MSPLSRIDHVILLLLVDDGWVWLFAGCCATWCPCVLMGRVAEIVDEGRTSCLSAGCLFFWLLALAGSCVIYSYGFRTRLREKYGLPPKPCGDFCSDYWCIWCSLAQETRELQNRGIDPALGNSTKTKPPPSSFPASI
jgi:Cys-rich protein (TIGR01571 family)